MIHICEVGPRDGLQNEKRHLSVQQRIELIERLMETGVRKIETVSFVNPKVVPQMSDPEEVVAGIRRKKGVIIAGLVLSPRGLERALETELDAIHFTLAVSDTFNQRNARRTAEQSVMEIEDMIRAAGEQGKPCVAILGTAFGCPFEGDVSEEKVLRIAERFIWAGCRNITLADTTGLANPLQVKRLVTKFFAEFGKNIELGLHFHNTRGLGLANVLAGYEAGVRHFDSSVGGTGGCPFAPKAVGNVCTEDMVNMFHSMGVDTGIDLERLTDVALWLEQQLERRLDGMMMKLK
ncbi:hydroxymethylglutaryl-CoA lyase [Geobacillus subterraneus]|uniref:hydroxymethylglutaryl-CoA lyase n=1 Tax=Geobacillus subterraneus TaxID=129338 RepID=UPI001442DAAA|nr:hydroxymethylglutaryl-CoA lyase [Geobacillus subterraneus]QIZ69135.1 hydroxymethylglutaryl-CoA lyase [Geobacillus subterraneus]